MEICTTMDLHGLQGTAYLTRVCATGGRGISALAPGAPLPPPSVTLLSVNFSHVVSLFSFDCCPTAGFSPLVNYVNPEVLPPLLMGLAFASSWSVSASEFATACWGRAGGASLGRQGGWGCLESCTGSHSNSMYGNAVVIKSDPETVR